MPERSARDMLGGSLRLWAEGKYGYLGQSAESEKFLVPDGADSCVTRCSRIVMQSIYYRLGPARS